LAAKVERRQAVSAAKASGEKGAVKAAREAAAPSVKAAKTTRKAFTGAEKKESAKAYHSTIKEAKKMNRPNKGKRATM
jgi:hypothetical protein